MNDMFSFEQSQWELLEQRLKKGSTLSALRFLSVFEQDEESAVEEAFETLLEKNVTLDISEIPEDYGFGELEKRLRLEAGLVAQGNLLSGLEETDPLRLYLEELARIPVQGDPALLAQLYLDGDERAAGKLVELQLHYAVELACEMTGRGVLLMDLIQEASLGFDIAMENGEYDNDRIAAYDDIYWTGDSDRVDAFLDAYYSAEPNHIATMWGLFSLLCSKHHINDIHAGNIGRIGDRWVLVDYSGYFD